MRNVGEVEVADQESGPRADRRKSDWGRGWLDRCCGGPAVSAPGGGESLSGLGWWMPPESRRMTSLRNLQREAEVVVRENSR